MLANLRQPVPSWIAPLLVLRRLPLAGDVRLTRGEDVSLRLRPAASRAARRGNAPRGCGILDPSAGERNLQTQSRRKARVSCNGHAPEGMDSRGAAVRTHQSPPSAHTAAHRLRAPR